MKERYIFIGIGAVIMLILSIIRRKEYDLPLWKAIVIPFIVAACGALGAMLLYFVESGGSFGGVSFYGGVILVPVLLYPFSKLLKMPYGKITDYIVPQGCIMLASMKVSCLVTGCCGGICLNPFTQMYFPSQLVEMIIALLIAVFIIYLDHLKLLKGRLCGAYLLLYGILRFVLNFLRDGLTPFVWIIPAGHFWSLISIAAGIAWFLLYKEKEPQAQAIEDSATENK